VDTLGVMKDKVVGKLLVKQFLVTDQLKVVIPELLLESSIVVLNIDVDLRIVRIPQQMGDSISLQYGIEAASVLASRLTLQRHFSDAGSGIVMQSIKLDGKVKKKNKLSEDLKSNLQFYVRISNLLISNEEWISLYIANPLTLLVPRAGLEPARELPPEGF